VAAELVDVRAALGDKDDVQQFVHDALVAAGAHVSGVNPITIDTTHVSAALKDALNLGTNNVVIARFEPPATDGEELLTRTHPFVSGLASYVLDSRPVAIWSCSAMWCGQN
jgi:hypothetical protein